MTISSGSRVTRTWNGPICPSCHRGYIGSHHCDVADLMRARDALQRLIDERMGTAGSFNPGFDPDACPCSPKRGGSGICGCVLGSQIIC